MMADDLALQGPHPHLANGSRGRSNLLPYQPHGFTRLMWSTGSVHKSQTWVYDVDFLEIQTLRLVWSYVSGSHGRT